MADQSSRRIEEDIAAERAALSETLTDLQSSLSSEQLVARAERMMRDHGGALVDEVSKRAARNPLAMAVTLAGLGWLVFGPPDRTLVRKVLPKGKSQRMARQTDGPAHRGSASRLPDLRTRQQHAKRWLLSFDPDPRQSLNCAKQGVTPDVALMIDQIEDGLSERPPADRPRLRQARLQAICHRMATQSV